jgi:UDP-N-acetylmuramate--alanine ligase
MHIHFVGIGGAGLSAIAHVLLGRGFEVSGSDMHESDRSAELAQAGATIHIGHAASQIDGADLVIISSAIPESNPELTAAHARGIPVLKRDDLLGHLMAGHIGIAVAGSHGKTTTTGMIAHLLVEAQRDPTFIIGGVLPTLATNGRAGDGPHFVIEADEYDHMFLGLQPEVAVITNIEHDHPDIYPTMDAYRSAFGRFARLLPADGRLVACVDDADVRDLLETLALDGVETVTYGIDEPAQIAATDIRPNPLGGSDFLVTDNGELVGLARVRIPGRHNVRNALAAIAVVMGLGVDFPTVRQALAGFGGMQRRFQELGTVAGVTVVDDYAHHPTEIRATLAGARQRYRGRRVWAVWQPHTYSRTKMLLPAFGSAFTDADRVVVLPIYRSRERDTLGLDAAQVAAAIEHEQAVYVGDSQATAAYILERILPDDVVLTLGAGDSDEVGKRVLQGLQARSERSA